MKKFKPLSIHVIRDHVLLGGLAAACLAPKLGIAGSLMFWAATVLFDLDHYLRFLLLGKFKKTGIQSMFAFFERSFESRNHPDFLALDVFHTAEFLIFFGLFVFYAAPFLLAVLWGFLFHMVVDFFHLLRHRALTKRAHSFVEYYIRKRIIERRGGNPEALNAKIYAG